MKRRLFLSTTGTVGVLGLASSSSLLASAYNSLNTSVLLAELPKPTRGVLDNFVVQLTHNVKSMNLKNQLIAQVAMPQQIIEQKIEKGQHKVVYQNRSGQYVTLSMNNGVEKIQVCSRLGTFQK